VAYGIQMSGTRNRRQLALTMAMVLPTRTRARGAYLKLPFGMIGITHGDHACLVNEVEIVAESPPPGGF